MITVKATREGLVGKKMATGITITTALPYVALPAGAALYRFVRVTNPLTGKSAVAVVLDVGPWNETDNAYVFRDARPQAEGGTDSRGRTTNGAGIDLGEAIWTALGMTDNGNVQWEFLS